MALFRPGGGFFYYFCDILMRAIHNFNDTFELFVSFFSNALGEKTVVAMGLLNTLETILVVMEDHPESILSLEPVLLQVVTYILDKSIMEFYEEAFSMISSLIEKQISPSMWSVFEGTYRLNFKLFIC